MVATCLTGQFLLWIVLVTTIVESLKFTSIPSKKRVDEHLEYLQPEKLPKGAYVIHKEDKTSTPTDRTWSRHSWNSRHARAASTENGVMSSNFTFQDDTNNYAIIYFSGDKSSIMFVLTYAPGNGQRYCRLISLHSRLWRSDDYGNSFSPVVLGNTVTLSPVFYINPDDKKEMIFGEEQDEHQQQHLHITVDEGLTFTSFPAPIDPATIDCHPTVVGLCMALAPDATADCSDQHGQLYISTDGGRHWTSRKDNVKSFFWEETQWELPLTVRGSKDNATFYYLLDDESSANVDKHTVHRSSVKAGSDGQEYAAEFDSALGNVFSFGVMGQFLWANKHNADQSQSLYISFNRQPFQKVRVPVEDSHQKYRLYLLDGQQLLLLVQHPSASNQAQIFWNLYLSDVTGLSYSLALEDLAYRGDQLFDLERMDGVLGTFVANQYLSGFSGNGNSVRTVISFDNGAEWSLVRAPPQVLTPSGSYCYPPSCSLHFHMSASANYTRSGVASWASIPGVIFAHGTVGSKLAVNPDLFVSRDGGVSWDKTLEGTWGVNAMDYGGVIVAAPDYHQSPTRQIKYTCTEGLQWMDHTFSPSENVVVWGVITEPGETTVVSFLYSTRLPPASRAWITFNLNFTSIFLKTCSSIDYYFWEPWNDRTDNEQNCQFGETLLIERRKVAVCCFNGGSYNRVVNATSCLCTDADFECDLGYKRSEEDGGPCVQDPYYPLEVPSCDDAEAFVYLSQGYRKIPGDHCVKGDTSDLDPIKVFCGNYNSTTVIHDAPGLGAMAGVFSVVVLILLAVVAALSVLSAVLFYRCKKMRTSYQLLSGGSTRYHEASEDLDTSAANPRVEFDGDDQLLEA